MIIGVTAFCKRLLKKLLGGKKMSRKKFSKVTLSLLTAALLAMPNVPLSVMSQPMYAATSQEEVSLKNLKAKDGIIIQMHMWSYNNIRSVLPDLAKAGFKSIQVSPVQPCKSGSEWWNLYQPFDQSIGNPLGSKEEFTALCREAESYGIDVIVDAIMNHMANKDEDHKDDWNDGMWARFKNSDYLHHNGQCYDYKSRWGTMQQGIGMPDLNTQHPQIQQYAKDFYVYDESGKNVKEVASWPGVKMTSIGNDTYKYKLPDGWENAY